MNKADIIDVIAKLDRNGYYYDPLESDDNAICVRYTGAVMALWFNSWEELKEWIDEVAEID